MKKYILLILCTTLTVLFPIFASAEGNTVSITDFGSINDAIAAAGSGGIVEYPAGEYGGITLNGASNANDITILFDFNFVCINRKCHSSSCCNRSGNLRAICRGFDCNAADGVRITIVRPCRHDDEAQDHGHRQ